LLNTECYVVLTGSFIIDLQIILIIEFILIKSFLHLFPNLFCKNFAKPKQPVIFEAILNFKNQIIPIFAKVQNSENSVFRRALQITILRLFLTLNGEGKGEGVIYFAWKQTA